ncbi:MAG: ribosomal protein S18-alanine N-acetyltransferase [Candidatus Thorarchaeota archaeon]
MTQDRLIREFIKDDVASVVEINRRTLPENYPESFFIGLHYHAPKAFLIAEKDGITVGYIMCRIERGISSFGKRPVKKGHIVSVAVVDAERRKGIGIDLIEASMSAMIEYGANEFFLEVRKSNEAAIGVYEKLGYEVKRVLRGYYRDGEDAYLMVKHHSEPAEEVEGQLHE